MAVWTNRHRPAEPVQTAGALIRCPAWACGSPPTSTARRRCGWSRSTASAPEHRFCDLNVGITLSGDLDDVHITGDNANVVTTDAQKNTVFAFARQEPVGEIEEFGLRLARHFVSGFEPIHRARVHIESAGWQRIEVDGSPHPHAFMSAGSELRTATAVCDADGEWVVSGIRGPGRAQDLGLGVHRLHQGPLHDAAGDDRADPVHGGHGALAPRVDRRRLGRVVRHRPDAAAGALRRRAQPVAAAVAVRDGARR